MFLANPEYFKGMRMAGRMGGDRVKVNNLRVLRESILEKISCLFGSVPGPKKISFVALEK
jgi:large subunit ribosomal protein L3